MELKLDTSKIYAIALEGGGARGAWQVGAWRALEEAGVRYNAVSGTSVGAINGALMAMRDLKQAEQIWKDIRFSQIINVDDEATLAIQFGVSSIPTLVVMKGGQAVAQAVGYRPKADIEKLLD